VKKVLFSILVVASFAVAQQPAAPGVVVQAQAGADTLRLLQGGGPGVYDMMNYDRTAPEVKRLENVILKNATDYKHFLTVMGDIENSFRGFMRDTIYNSEDGLKTLSDNSTQAGKITPAIELLKAINRYNGQRTELEVKIEALTAIGNGAVPSRQVIDEKGKLAVNDLPGFGQENFEPIKKFYREKLTAMDTFVANLPHIYKTGTGVDKRIAANSGKGLIVELPATAVSGDEIRRIQKEIRVLRAYKAEDKDAINSFTKYMADQCRKFIKTYGTKWYVLGPEETEQRNRDAKVIADMFWLRSYMRTIYGVGIGAMDVPYEKRFANLESITMLTEMLGNIRQEPVWDADLLESAQRVRFAAIRADVRAKEIFNGDLNLIQSGENILVYLGGKHNLAEALNLMLRLLAADMYEERLINEADGNFRMVQRYRSRYGNTPENEIYYTRLQMVYHPDAVDEDEIRNKYKDNEKALTQLFGKDGDDPFGEEFYSTGSGGSLKAKYTVALDALTVLLANADVAAEKQAELNNMINQNASFKALKKRTSKLFN
jgi:hypothetical protein